MDKDLAFLKDLFEMLAKFFQMIIAAFTGGNTPGGDDEGGDDELD